MWTRCTNASPTPNGMTASFSARRPAVPQTLRTRQFDLSAPSRPVRRSAPESGRRRYGYKAHKGHSPWTAHEAGQIAPSTAKRYGVFFLGSVLQRVSVDRTGQSAQRRSVGVSGLTTSPAASCFFGLSLERCANLGGRGPAGRRPSRSWPVRRGNGQIDAYCAAAVLAVSPLDHSRIKL